MGSRLRVLSGVDVVKIFAQYGFVVKSQHSSHIKLHRAGFLGEEIIVVPDHSPIKKGTLAGIYKRAARYLTEQELKQHFYT
jgi:predicted RNA binding protein YcfA (HicA-like mRNA interferase family)